MGPARVPVCASTRPSAHLRLCAMPPFVNERASNPCPVPVRVLRSLLPFSHLSHPARDTDVRALQCASLPPPLPLQPSSYAHPHTAARPPAHERHHQHHRPPQRGREYTKQNHIKGWRAGENTRLFGILHPLHACPGPLPQERGRGQRRCTEPTWSAGESRRNSGRRRFKMKTEKRRRAMWGRGFVGGRDRSPKLPVHAKAPREGGVQAPSSSISHPISSPPAHPACAAPCSSAVCFPPHTHTPFSIPLSA